MKKKRILLLLLFLQSIVYAQSDMMRFGIKGGINFSTIVETAQRSELSRKSTTGEKKSFHFGVVFEHLFSERISFQVEALYSAQGANLIEAYSTSNGRKVVRYLNYINFPVLAKYYATPGFSVEVGPQVGVLLDAKDDFGNVGQKNILKEVRQHDFSVVAGVAYEFYNGIFIQGRYNIGLLDVNGKGRGVINYYRHRNSVLQVSVGYIF